MMLVVTLSFFSLLLWRAEHHSRRQLEQLQRQTSSWRRVSYDGLTIVLLGLALCGAPQSHGESSSSSNLQIALVIDVSTSMAAEENSQTRLQQAIMIAEQWLEQLPGVSWSIIPFAGEPILQVPPTRDLEAVSFFLRTLSPGMITSPGSDPEAAVLLAQQTLSGQTGDRAILMLSDGERTLTTSPAKIDKSIPVFTMAIGNPSGAPLPAATGGLRTDSAGHLLLSTPDPQRLVQLAAHSGGRVLTGRQRTRPRELLEAYVSLPGLPQEPDQQSALLPLLILGLLYLRQLLQITLSRKNRNRWLAACSAFVLLSCQTQPPETDLNGLLAAASQAESTGQRERLLTRLLQESADQGALIRQRALFNAGTLFLQRDQIDAAIPLLKQALQITGDDAAASHNLALALRSGRQAPKRNKGTGQFKQQSATGSSAPSRAAVLKATRLVIHPLARGSKPAPAPTITVERDW